MHQRRDPRYRYRDYAKGLIVLLSRYKGAAAMPPLFYAERRWMASAPLALLNRPEAYGRGAVKPRRLRETRD